MYKFNLLNKINIQKQKADKINRIVNMFFYSAVTISVVLISIMVFKSLIVGNSRKDIQQNLDEINAKANKLHQGSGFLSNRKISQLYEYQTKRIVWTKLFTALEADIDSLSAVDELNYNESTMDCKILVRVNQANNNKAAIMKIMTNYQTKLSKDSVLIAYLKDKSGSSIAISEPPNLEQNEGQNNTWYYKLKFNLRDIVKPTAVDASQANNKARF